MRMQRIDCKRGWQTRMANEDRMVLHPSRGLRHLMFGQSCSGGQRLACPGKENRGGGLYGRISSTAQPIRPLGFSRAVDALDLRHGGALSCVARVRSGYVGWSRGFPGRFQFAGRSADRQSRRDPGIAARYWCGFLDRRFLDRTDGQRQWEREWEWDHP